MDGQVVQESYTQKSTHQIKTYPQMLKICLRMVLSLSFRNFTR
jgi:hypothetical protein